MAVVVVFEVVKEWRVRLRLLDFALPNLTHPLSRRILVTCMTTGPAAPLSSGLPAVVQQQTSFALSIGFTKYIYDRNGTGVIFYHGTTWSC